MNEKAKKMTEISAALDACGIGHDIGVRLRAGNLEIAEFIKIASDEMSAQFAHNLMINIPAGIDLGGQTPVAHAIESGIVSAVGKMIDWDIYEARRFCALILQETNDHEEAATMFRKAEECMESDDNEQPAIEPRKEFNDWAPVVKSLIDELKKECLEPIGVNDGEEYITVQKSSPTETITSVDESVLYVKDETGMKLAVFIVLGNEPEEIVNDYSADERIGRAVAAHSETWEGVPCPIGYK